MLQQLADVISKMAVAIATTGCFCDILADVICQVTDGLLQQLAHVDCQVTDGIATGSDYFSLSSGVLSRTSSHMCGRWYLPTFLLRDGLLMFMNECLLLSIC